MDFQIPSKISFSLKNMAARGRGHFSICYFVNVAYFQHISAITFTKCKQFPSNSTNLLTITRATFWPKHITVMYFDKIISLYGFWKTDMAIASILLKLFSSNFNHLFFITRATFWLRATSLKYILTKLFPFIDLKKSQMWL